MKPGKNDKRFQIRIEGLELKVLHKLTYMMCEAFGLDRKIEAYKGTRPISLYSWDLDCLEGVMFNAARDLAGEGIRTKKEIEAFESLAERIRVLIASDREGNK